VEFSFHACCYTLHVATLAHGFTINDLMCKYEGREKIVIIVKQYNPPRMTIPTAGSKAVVGNRIQSIQLRLRNELSVLGVRKLHGHSSK